MFDKEFKYQILQECVKIQEGKIKIVHDAMNEHQLMANEYGPPRDRYDSFRSQLLRKRDLFASQYQKALDELKILTKINISNDSKTVEFGSLVITSSQNLFIATGLGKINVNGHEVYVISTKVPVYMALEGLSEKNTFHINNNEFVINQVL